MQNNDNIIYITYEDGNQVGYELLDAVEYQGKTYALLLTLGGEDDRYIKVFSVKRKFSGKNLMEEVSDQAMFENVYGAYLEQKGFGRSVLRRKVLWAQKTSWPVFSLGGNTLQNKSAEAQPEKTDPVIAAEANAPSPQQSAGEEPQIITLPDGDGVGHDFALLDIVEYAGDQYAVMFPVDDDEASLVTIMRLRPQGGDNVLFESVNDDNLLSEVYEYFVAKNKDKYNFG